MYVSCSSLVYTLAECPDVRDAVGRLKGRGFRALDLAAFEGWQNVDPSRLADGDEAWVRGLAEALAAADMRVSSINAGPSRAVNDPALDAFAQYRREYAALLDLAEAVGCGNITVQPGGSLEGHDVAELLATATEHLAALAPLGAARGMTLSV
ncbi:MAG TPA: TIM barrel protein, partial [Terriglobia bacterium]|nr:TIM barrel protein [Terriglobia bacterium]